MRIFAKQSMGNYVGSDNDDDGDDDDDDDLPKEKFLDAPMTL